MRLLPLLALASIVAATFVLAPVEARPVPVCIQARQACPDDYCVDSNLDGKFTSQDACVGFVCPQWGCCGTPTCAEPMSGPSTESTDAAAACTPYANVAGTKQRTCVDASQAPECGAWTEGWTRLGYYRACYGTGAIDVGYSTLP